jgi:hypothetical protein
MAQSLTGCKLSTAEEASKFVQILVSAYPPYQRQGDYEVYLRMMAEACTGVPLPVLRDMVRPKTGLLGKSRWMPSVSDVSDWIDGYQRKYQVTTGEPLAFREERFFDRNGRVIEGKTFSEPQTPEQRAEHAAMLDDLSSTLRAAAEAAKRGSGPSLPAWVASEEEAKEGRARGLAYLDSMRSPAVQGDKE